MSQGKVNHYNKNYTVACTCIRALAQIGWPTIGKSPPRMIHEHLERSNAQLIFNENTGTYLVQKYDSKF